MPEHRKHKMGGADVESVKIHGGNRSRWFGGGESLRRGRGPLGENLQLGEDVL